MGRDSVSLGRDDEEIGFAHLGSSSSQDRPETERGIEREERSWRHQIGLHRVSAQLVSASSRVCCASCLIPKWPKFWAIVEAEDEAEIEATFVRKPSKDLDQSLFSGHSSECATVATRRVGK